MYPIVCAWSMRLSKGEYVVWPDGCRDLIVVVSRGRIPRMLCTGLDAAVRRVVLPSLYSDGYVGSDGRQKTPDVGWYSQKVRRFPVFSLRILYRRRLRVVSTISEFRKIR